LFVHANPDSHVVVSPWTGADVLNILEEQGWAQPPAGDALQVWCERAASLLGPHAPEHDGLRDLLSLVFHYDAAALLREVKNQAVMTRSGSREVIRELANRVLDCPELDSDAYKTIIGEMKAKLRYRGRGLFFPIRLALGGRAGEGELDRVILLLDRAAELPFARPVKSARERMLEFCTAVD
jgi:hypothetical protein